jgi:ferredoxin
MCGRTKAKLDSTVEEFTAFTKEEIETLFRELPSYYIDPEKCKACGTCIKRCQMHALSPGKDDISIVDRTKCIGCGACAAVCPAYFKMDKDGRATLIKGKGKKNVELEIKDETSELKDAVNSCPVQCIKIVK